MSKAAIRLLRFDTFEMDVESGQLHKNGTRLKLPPQPFRVLALLAARPGRVLTRQEIERELWGGETHVDFSGGLNYCIRQIRSILGDDAESPRYIETLPKRGYRFLASVGAVGAQSADSNRPMLAVLPFGNLTGYADQEYFSDGLTEELIAHLGRINPGRLGVIAFTTTRQYKNSDKGIDRIGADLGVDFIVEGSVRRAGNRVRISVQLIRVSDQSHLWAEAYNHTSEDIISVQIDVAERVANSLAVELLGGRGAMVRSATHVSAAHEAYLKGRYRLIRRTEADCFAALKCFEQALAQDPAFVPAYAGVAEAYEIAGFYSGIPPKDAYEGSMRAIRKALDLDSGYADIHTMLAHVQMHFERDFSASEQSFRRALELNPNHVTGHYWFAFLLTALGRFDQALQQIDEAIQLDPLSLVMSSNRGLVLYFAGRYNEAAAQLRNTIDTEAEFALTRYLMGAVCLALSQYPEAAAEFQKAWDLSGHHPAPLAGLACARALDGKKGAARSLLKDLQELSRQRYVTPYYPALVYVALDDADRAFACLDLACEDRSAALVYLKNDPGLSGIRKDPRFPRLARRMGLPA